MNTERLAVVRAHESAPSTNKVIRNTYLLLSMTLAFSAVTAGVSMAVGAQPMHWIVLLAVMIGGPFAIHALRNSVWSLPLTFAFTGALGWFLGPVLTFYLSLPNGGEIVTTAMGMTAAIFLGLSAYALTTRKDFSFLGGFVVVGFLVVLAAIIANIILFDTSRMVNGGETNYVTMTVALYSNLYVLFLHLLNLISAFTGDD